MWRSSHEAEGRGFRAVVADALAAGVPVLTAVNHLNEGAFVDFTGGLATKLPADADALSDWAVCNIHEADMARPRYNNPDLILSDLVTRWPVTIPVFLKYRMLCVGCMVTSFQTVEDACREHGVGEAVFRTELQQSLEPLAPPDG